MQSNLKNDRINKQKTTDVASTTMVFRAGKGLLRFGRP